MNFEKPLTSQFVRIMASFASQEAIAPSWSCPPLPSQATVLKTALLVGLQSQNPTN